MQFDYQDFDRRYRLSLGSEIAGGAYSIFYSQISPSSLMIIGHNPGGDPVACGAQSLEIVRGFHDYVDNAKATGADRYPLATAMRRYLVRVLAIDVDGIRRIPKINLVFRRSESEATFAGHHGGMSMWGAACHDRPFVEEIIKTVDPAAIIFEGHKAWEKFCAIYCTSDCATETIVQAGRNVRLVQLSSPFVECLGRSIQAVILAHPSTYGTWGAMTDGDGTVRAHLGL